MSKFRSPDIFRFCQNQHIGSIVGFPKGFPYIGIPIGISLYGRLASDIDYRQMSNVRCEIVSPRLVRLMPVLVAFPQKQSMVACVSADS